MRLKRKATPMDICFAVTALALCARVVFLLCKQDKIASLCFKVVYVSVALLVVTSMYSFFKHRAYAKDGLLTLILSAILILVVIGLVDLLGKPMGSYLTTVTFLIVLLLLILRRQIVLSEWAIKIYFWMMSALGVVLCVALLFDRFYQDGVLLLYTGNPNQSGLLYMCIFANVFIYRFWGKKTMFCAAFLNVELLLLLFGCACTNSRSALITCLLCVVLGGVFAYKRSSVKPVLELAWLLFALFPFVYLALARMMNGNVQIFGKLLFSGRETVWKIYLQEILLHPFETHIGKTIDLSQILYQAAFNAHNAWLHVAWEYSLLAGMLFLLAMLILMRKGSRNMRANKEQRLILACACAGLFHMTFEASLIVGALDFTLFYLMPLFLGINCKNDEGSQKLKNKGN